MINSGICYKSQEGTEDVEKEEQGPILNCIVKDSLSKEVLLQESSKC